MSKRDGYDHEANSKFKNWLRELVWDLIPDSETVSNYLTLPGKNIMDIKKGINTGKLPCSEDTKIWAFERDTSLLPHIKTECKKQWSKKGASLEYLFLENNTIENDPLIPDVLWNSLEDPYILFDLAFFDFCGQLSEDIYHFCRAIPLLTSKAAFTFSIPTRCQNDFYRKNKDRLRKSFNLRGIRHSFYEANENTVYKSKWICDNVLRAMGLTHKNLKDFHLYIGNNCAPMVFFTVDNIPYETSQSKKVFQMMFDDPQKTLDTFPKIGRMIDRKAGIRVSRDDPHEWLCEKLREKETMLEANPDSPGRKAAVTRAKNDLKQFEKQHKLIESLKEKGSQMSMTGA